MARTLAYVAIVLTLISPIYGQEHWSGVYPHLTMRNDEGECGTGAVVPWQGSLWVITYAPHKPGGSSDKLYEITPDVKQRILDGSVGGTPANRMIHRESNQLLIGPYVIDSNRKTRVILPSVMYGRLTGNARHLTDPANKVYYATMEEGLYEVDVNSLAVKCLIRDGNGGAPKTGVVSKLPGYHGKGLYSGQNHLIYANNGDRDPRVKVDPTIPSGALATWQGKGDWQLVRRNQFTEVTGPGGIYGSPNPESDPVWAMGWDARSVILALFESQQWYYYRLPKGSHSYDGAHGWNTEWPRIREIGEDDLLATMHGTFWRFPSGFSRANSAGIVPRSNYLKVIGDFCRWNDRIVLGCDDSAKSEFLNTRSFKAKHGSPGQSNSNLWFVDPARLDQLGPAIGRGSVWLREDVKADEISDPYLFSGYDYRQLHLTHGNNESVTFTLEVDRNGTDQWEPLREITVPSDVAVSHVFEADETGSWIRLTSQNEAAEVSAHFQYRKRDPRGAANNPLFAGIASVGETAHSYGRLRSLTYNRLGLVAADNPGGEDAAYYELNQKMELVPVEASSVTGFISAVQQPRSSITVDDASVVIVEDGKRYRLPKSDRYMPALPVSDDRPSLEDHLGNHLAIGAKVRVSSMHASYAARNAVDGRITDDARWIGRNKGGVWIELDFGRPRTFESIWVITGWKNSSQYAVANFDIQIKRDDKWQTLPNGTVRNNSDVRREIIFAEPVTAQHLRLVSETDDYLRVYEIAPFANTLNIARNSSGFATARVCREVATERDLLNLHGTFYELPARNAQGLAKIRPIATHNLAIHDFCSHNGLLLFTGVDADTESHHIVRSADRKATVWAGVVDDLWKLGKPRGIGGPWHNTEVNANEPSDPYLMTAYDHKQAVVTSSEAATIRLEVDIDGTGLWIPYQSFKLAAGQTVKHNFPAGFSAYWVRAVSDARTIATVTFIYN
ncbi:MAG TPA: discoidin domain-containing protein [Pirellulaceae bacterium]|nr:discoidin domain-containing protein [Pirellulaceae bacterium]